MNAKVGLVGLCAVAVLGVPAARATVTPTLTTLVNFSGGNGSYPQAGLAADAAGNLYGTTYGGGSGGNSGYGYGTVFKLAADTHAMTTLVAFGSTAVEFPSSTLLADAAGDLYGTATYGGAGGDGTVFEVAAGTRAVTTLGSFNYTNGANPYAGLVADTGGSLYGTTSVGGSGGYGTVFEVIPSVRALGTLASFNGTNGQSPQGGVVFDAAGNLYGTTTQGGGSNDGTVFEVAARTHTLTTLVTFNGANGDDPNAGLIADAAGNLYGTTAFGGPGGYGTVFEVAAGTHALTTLAVFTSAGGQYPMASLILDAAGDLFGTTSDVGAGNGHDGTVFEVVAGSGVVTTLASFNSTDGGDPNGGLVADAAGNLYGTTVYGGTSNDGVVFELSGTGFVVPEPAPLAVLPPTLAALGLLRRRRRGVGTVATLAN